MCEFLAGIFVGIAIGVALAAHEKGEFDDLH